MSKDEKSLEAIMDRRREYYIAHRELRLAYAARYYKKNKEVIKTKMKKKAAEDPDHVAKRKEYHRKYYLKKKSRSQKSA